MCLLAYHCMLNGRAFLGKGPSKKILVELCFGLKEQKSVLRCVCGGRGIYMCEGSFICGIKCAEA